MLIFEDYKLGEINNAIQIDSKKENYSACLSLAEQAGHTLEIISRDLDPQIFDQPDFIQAIKNLALKSRRSRIRILIFEVQSIIRRGHRLIELASQLSSFIEIRKPANEFKDYNEGLLLADNTAYVQKKNADRYEAKLNFSDKRQSKMLLKEFEEMWETAKPDPNLRRMSI